MSHENDKSALVSSAECPVQEKNMHLAVWHYDSIVPDCHFFLRVQIQYLSLRMLREPDVISESHGIAPPVEGPSLVQAVDVVIDHSLNWVFSGFKAFVIYRHGKRYLRRHHLIELQDAMKW